ncbi:hypothetical protein [Psychroserpens mesophilus]|uniref:hypothetical protein n=1 Tax=Psychroserpens mesophilus TaxID=325473 RepID=UPI003D6523A6
MNHSSTIIKPILIRLFQHLEYMTIDELKLYKKIISLPALDNTIPQAKQQRLMKYLLELEQVVDDRIKRS